MWMLLGVAAIITAILNIIFAIQRKTNKWFGFCSLSLTALALCAFYSDAANRVIHEDWAGLMDILPTMSKALWVCVIASILVNSVPLLIKREN
ncbi:hypothetical protein [uncultured Clostridium sp.]|uniref:hypothetical protein n=1 Tax=uncultured Clostridium sp. TaxID=59620 RepID=UPI0028E58BAB|nr:hypothetical protein [uncultured Clostridium sp.]